MKNALVAAASAAALVSLAPALAHAQTAPSTGLYGTLGYANTHTQDLNLGSIQGRLGYRMGTWLGVEGELSGGVKGEERTEVVNGVPVSGDVKLKESAAIYAVGFAPITPNLDLIGRVGYGGTRAKVSASGAGVSLSEDIAGDSWNFGLGAQYHLDGQNGLRVDYTRQEFRDEDAGHADVWSVAFTRRF
jgi:opacity protein-like surface antigen